MARGTFASQSGLEVGRLFQVKRLGRLALGVIATPDDPSGLWEGHWVPGDLQGLGWCATSNLAQRNLQDGESSPMRTLARSLVAVEA